MFFLKKIAFIISIPSPLTYLKFSYTPLPIYVLSIKFIRFPFVKVSNRIYMNFHFENVLEIILQFYLIMYHYRKKSRFLTFG